jgi:pimeloyl-ACP methyl ester carboxylesterase
MPTWIKRSLKTLVVAIALAAAAGFIYEQAGRSLDRKRLPPQLGQSVDIGGRTMNIYCSGDGSPAVIFESGGNNPGYDWVLVQPKVASVTRACWYDRAGVGWSDPPPAPRSSATIANDLHELLRRAGVQPPYVLVGQSIGGEYVRVFAAKYPAEVAGLVLVDSSHPDQHEPPSMKGPVSRLPVAVRRLVCLIQPALVRFGIVRWLSRRQRQSAPSEMSPEQQQVYRLLKGRPTAVIAGFAEVCHGTRGGIDLPDTGTGNPEVDNAARNSGKLGDRPLIVLTAGQYGNPIDPVEAREISAFHEVWVHKLQADLARLSTRGRQIVVDNSGHGIQIEAPDAVVNAVRDVVAEVRQTAN